MCNTSADGWGIFFSYLFLQRCCISNKRYYICRHLNENEMTYSNTAFTEKENALINAIIKSDYATGDILDPVWMVEPRDCGFDNKKTLSGVVSQLVQKGIIETGGGTGKDLQVVFTERFAAEYYNN